MNDITVDGMIVFTEEQKEALKQLVDHLKQQDEILDKAIDRLEGEDK